MAKSSHSIQCELRWAYIINEEEEEEVLLLLLLPPAVDLPSTEMPAFSWIITMCR